MLATTFRPSTLGIKFFVDPSVMVDGAPNRKWEQIQRYEADRRIDLVRSSALGDDLAKDQDSGRRQRLESAFPYAEVCGPLVPGESRHRANSFDPTADEWQLLYRVFTTLFPNAKWSSDSRTASNNRRDAMHLFTAVKYGTRRIITRDDSVLRKADELQATFGLKVFSPSRAVAFIERQIRNHNEMQRRNREWGATPLTKGG